MDKQAMLESWDEFNKTNTWFAGIQNAFDGLTPQQAAWKPDAGGAGAKGARHSIWQVLNHICYWREVVAKRSVTKQQPAEEEIARMNWEEPTEPTESAWRQSRERLTRSQRLIRDVIESGALTYEKFKYVIPHDAYHVGQAMYVRALQGMKPIE
ncbi:MAG: DinB family protein [Anaerolineae bacterium]|nr:DinB family protein [Phycisphaerae bacterium]